MKNNIISPSTKSEELRILATKKLDELAHVANSNKEQAKDNVVNAAHYAVYDAPRIAYDYVNQALDGEHFLLLFLFLIFFAQLPSLSPFLSLCLLFNHTDDYGFYDAQFLGLPTDTKDYVWSTWNEGQLRHYLESKGIVDTPAQAQKSDLISAVKKTYAETADNVYDTWSDSYLVSPNVFGLSYGLCPPYNECSCYLCLM